MGSTGSIARQTTGFRNAPPWATSDLEGVPAERILPVETVVLRRTLQPSEKTVRRIVYLSLFFVFIR